MESTNNPKGKQMQSIFRIGKYAIQQIPHNIVLGEIGFDIKFNERLIQGTKSYHSTYEKAMEALYDRLLKDNMAQSSLDHIRTIIKSIKEAKEEIIKELRKST
jgi:hypothetical protein